jgi:hypothetical protein
MGPMTQEDWLVCDDPAELLGSLGEHTSGRKSRLFAVACCRRIAHLLDDGRSRAAVEAAERYADEVIAAEEFARDAWAAEAAAKEAFAWTDAGSAAFAAAKAAAYRTAYDESGEPSRHYGAHVAGAADYPFERAAQCLLLRDVYNPFWTGTFDPSWWRWGHGAIRLLARQVYDGRAFGRLPEVADLLEGAGCADPALLDHLRGPGPHVRGCWALDLILEKD